MTWLYLLRAYSICLFLSHVLTHTYEDKKMLFGWFYVPKKFACKQSQSHAKTFPNVCLRPSSRSFSPVSAFELLNIIPSVSWGCKILDDVLSVNLTVILPQFVVTSTNLHLNYICLCNKKFCTYQIQTHVYTACVSVHTHTHIYIYKSSCSLVHSS